jgi:transporter family-2 protein
MVTAMKLSRWQFLGAGLLSVLAGIAMAAQSRVNGELGKQIHNGTMAGTISNLVGLCFLIVILAASPAGRRGWGLMVAAIAQRRLNWLFTFAGTAGAIMIALQGILVSVIGVALFTVAFVAGNSLGALFIDKWGVGPAGKRALSTRRITGVALGIAAVAVAGSGRLGHPELLWPMVIPFIAGACVAWQQAANGRITAVALSPVTGTFLNFVVGSGVLLIAMIPIGLIGGTPETYPTQWWMYLGGPLGVFFVGTTGLMVRAIGVLVFGLCATLGQLVAAMGLDLLFPGQSTEPVSMLIGIMLMAVAVLVASLRRRRTTSPQVES